jgi:predicted  nucleic acid-binding Zn-ribbon protein
MALSGAARQAAFRARQQAKRHDEFAALRLEAANLQRRVDDRDVEIAALRNESEKLRDENAALCRDNVTLEEALRAARRAAKRRPGRGEAGEA